MSKGAKRDTSNRYELIACALEGHALVGTDVATIEPEDALVVREYDGLRWHRCLRCDAWLPRQVPAEPTATACRAVTRSRCRCAGPRCAIDMSCGSSL